AAHLLPKFPPLFALHAQTVHGDIKVFALLNPVADSTNERKRLSDRRSLVCGCVEVAIPYSLIDHKLYVGLCLSATLVIRGNAVFSDEIVRISVVWENQNLYFDVFCQNRFDRPLRRSHARAIP